MSMGINTPSFDGTLMNQQGRQEAGCAVPGVGVGLPLWLIWS